MKKDEILVIFETHTRAKWFIDDKILQLMPFLQYNEKTKVYESDTFVVRPLSLANEDNLRGRRPDAIYLTDECTLRQYNIVLALVKGDHNKIRIVM